MSDKPIILIIEDDIDLAESMRIILAAQSFCVIHVDNPEEGFQKAKEKKPNLIILDVMFGSGQEALGFQYAVKMKEDKDLAPIPILMATAVNIEHPGYGFSNETDEYYLPVDGFIDKPLEFDDLVQKVKQMLEKKISKWVNWPTPSP
jgi:DNA-binding response OmpR family regulator